MARGVARRRRLFRDVPIWARITLPVAVIAFAVLATATVNRPLPKASGSTTVAAPTSAAPAVKLPASPRLVVFGDSYVQGYGVSSPTGGFAYRIAADLKWPVKVDGVHGTGYATPGSAGVTYQQRLDKAGALDGNVIIVEGGLNDRRTDPARVHDAAVAFFADLKKKARGAVLIVLGPVCPTPEHAATTQATSAAIQTAATAAGLPYIDPVAGGWITPGNEAQMIGPDHLHPTQAGYNYIGDQTVAMIRQLAGR